MKTPSDKISKMIQQTSGELTTRTIVQLLDIVQALNDRMDAAESERKELNADWLRETLELRSAIRNSK